MYTEFAKVYDLFMEDIPYEKWAKYILKLLREKGIESGNVCELGCGTGTITELLADAGYDMIGIDNSPDMLAVASSKLKEEQNIVYANMDMTELDLPYEADAIISVCDSMNYVIEDGDLELTIKRVYDCLKDGGVFIFDLKSEYFYEKVLGTTTIAESREEASFIWENTYYEDEKINEYILTLFIEGEDGRYDKYVEEHLQRAYSLEEVTNILKKVDFFEIEVYNAFTKKEPTKRTERYYFVCKKGEK